MARKAFVVNDAVREKVRHLAGIGVRQDDIAKIIGCAPKTLRKRCRDDLDRGVAEANAMVSGYLFAAAKAGNVAAQIFWLKTRAHWRERAAAGPLGCGPRHRGEFTGRPRAARQRPRPRADAGAARHPGEALAEKTAAVDTMNRRSDYHGDPGRPTTQGMPSLGALGSASAAPEQTASALCE